MTDTIERGMDRHHEWMVQVVSCDCTTGARRDYLEFFNTRIEAETHAEQFVRNLKGCNLIIKILVVEHIEREI